MLRPKCDIPFNTFLGIWRGYEFFYIVSGNITHRLNNKKETLNVGNLMFIKPTDKHEFLRPADCAHRDIVVSKIFFESTCNFISQDIFSEIISLNNSIPFLIDTDKMYYLEKN